MNFFNRLTNRAKIVFIGVFFLISIIFISLIYYINNRTSVTIYTDANPINITISDKTYILTKEKTKIYINSGFYRYRAWKQDGSFQLKSSVNLWDTKNQNIYIKTKTYNKTYIEKRLCDLGEEVYCSVEANSISVKFFEKYTWAIIYRDQQPDIILSLKEGDWDIFSHTEAGSHPDGFLPTSIEEALEE